MTDFSDLVGLKGDETAWGNILYPNFKKPCMCTHKTVIKRIIMLTECPCHVEVFFANILCLCHRCKLRELCRIINIAKKHNWIYLKLNLVFFPKTHGGKIVLHHFVVMFFGSSEIMNCMCLHLKTEFRSRTRGVGGVASFITIDEQIQ